MRCNHGKLKQLVFHLLSVRMRNHGKFDVKAVKSLFAEGGEAFFGLAGFIANMQILIAICDYSSILLRACLFAAYYREDCGERGYSRIRSLNIKFTTVEQIARIK